MSRPPVTTHTPPQWATVANYPAGAEAWAGAPTKVTPPGTYFVPGQPIPADYQNDLFYRNGASHVEVKSVLDAVSDYTFERFSAPKNFSQKQGSNAGIVWSPVDGFWIALDYVAGDVTPIRLSPSFDGFGAIGAAVTVGGGFPVRKGRGAACASGNLVFRCGTRFFVYKPNQTAGTGEGSLHLRSVLTGVDSISDLVWDDVNARLVAVSHKVAGTCKGLTWAAPDDANDATVITLPAGQQGWTSKWLLETDGAGRTIAINTECDGSYMFTDDGGATWTEVPIGVLPSDGVTYLPTGLAYDPSQGLWVFTEWDTADKTRIYTSETGGSWVHVGTITSGRLEGVACAFGCVLVSMLLNPRGFPNNSWIPVFSTDAGASWHACAGYSVDTVTVSDFACSTTVVSPSQALVSRWGDTPDVLVSEVIGHGDGIL